MVDPFFYYAPQILPRQAHERHKKTYQVVRGGAIRIKGHLRIKAAGNVADDLDGSTVDGTGGKPRNVTTRTVDSIVKEQSLEGPFLLKFDTHGYELPILAGAKETLAETNIVVMEAYNFKRTDHALRFHEMCAHMEQRGFRCHDIAGPMLRLHDKAFWQMDILFTRSDSALFSYSE